VTTPFSAAPTIVAIPLDSNGTAVGALGSVTTGTGTLGFRNSANALVDTSFQFVIVGPV
jgi:hypothetical protein